MSRFQVKQYAQEKFMLTTIREPLHKVLAKIFLFFYLTLQNCFVLYLKVISIEKNDVAIDLHAKLFYEFLNNYFSLNFELRNCATANLLIELNWYTDWNKLRVNNNDVDVNGDKHGTELGKIEKLFFLSLQRRIDKPDKRWSFDDVGADFVDDHCYQLISCKTCKTFSIKHLKLLMRTTISMKNILVALKKNLNSLKRGRQQKGMKEKKTRFLAVIAHERYHKLRIIFNNIFFAQMSMLHRRCNQLWSWNS